MKVNFVSGAFIAGILAVSCATNPVTDENFKMGRKPLGAWQSALAGIIPGVGQILHGEYIEGAVYASIFAASIAGFSLSSVDTNPDPGTYSPKAVPGSEVVFALSAAGILAIGPLSFFDAWVTSNRRTKQYLTLLANPERLASNFQIGEVTFDSVFPAFYKTYIRNPLGSVVVENLSQVQDITDLRFSLQIGDYVDPAAPDVQLERLSAGHTAEVQLYVPFRDAIASIEEGTPLKGKLLIRYSFGFGELEKTSSFDVRVLGRNSFDWREYDAIATFVSPVDGPVADYAYSIAKSSPYSDFHGLPENLYLATVVFEGLGGSGVLFTPDPLTPFDEYGTKHENIDSIQFPRETLRVQMGDVDELSILYTSVLEALGVPTGFIFGPDFLVPAFLVDAGQWHSGALSFL